MEPGTQLFAQLQLAAVLGGITAGVAVHKGRSAVGWFFVGFLTGCIGLIIVLCMSNVHDQNATLGNMETETRRLREQLKHEQLRNDSFQSYMRHRVDAHDGVLGMNTRGGIGPGRRAPQSIGSGHAPPGIAPGGPQYPAAHGHGGPPVAPGYSTSVGAAHAPAPVHGPWPVHGAPPPPGVHGDAAPLIGSEWFVKFGQRKSQSLTFGKLKKFWKIGNLTPDTLVCTGENERWVPVQDVPGLLDSLQHQESQTW